MTAPASLTTFLVILLSFTLNKCLVCENIAVSIILNSDCILVMIFRLLPTAYIQHWHQLERETKDIKVHLRPREWHTLTA